MSEPDDLLGKADAFLKRFHPSSTSAQHDVPVLTEVIAEPREAPAKPDANATVQGVAAKTELADLERRLKQSILDAVAAHIAKTVEEPLKARLDTQVQNALTTLSAQFKSDLEMFVREAVARAVAAEIARMRGPSRGA